MTLLQKVQTEQTNDTTLRLRLKAAMSNFGVSTAATGWHGLLSAFEAAEGISVGTQVGGSSVGLVNKATLMRSRDTSLQNRLQALLNHFSISGTYPTWTAKIEALENNVPTTSLVEQQVPKNTAANTPWTITWANSGQNVSGQPWQVYDGNYSNSVDIGYATGDGGYHRYGSGLAGIQWNFGLDGKMISKAVAKVGDYTGQNLTVFLVGSYTEFGSLTKTDYTVLSQAVLLGGQHTSLTLEVTSPEPYQYYAIQYYTNGDGAPMYEVDFWELVAEEVPAVKPAGVRAGDWLIPETGQLSTDSNILVNPYTWTGLEGNTYQVKYLLDPSLIIPVLPPSNALTATGLTNIGNNYTLIRNFGNYEYTAVWIVATGEDGSVETFRFGWELK